MAGIGKYTKGKRFTLKSGNSPAFKMMAGDSPITNEFGIGKGTSPYAQLADPKQQAEAMKEHGNKMSGDKEEKEEEKKGSVGGKILGAIGAAAAGGLNAVYGSKVPSPSEILKKKESDDKEITNKKAGELFAETE
jgi:hypothetical protein